MESRMSHDEASKNHSGGLNDNESHEKLGRIYLTEGPNHGYTALQLYLTKLNPKYDAFFQFPKRNWSHPSEDVWCKNRYLGVNKLGNKWWRSWVCLPSCLELTPTILYGQQQYTLWSNAVLSNWHIMAVSGHRNEQSLQSYHSGPSSDQLQQCSNVLSRASRLPIVQENQMVQSSSYAQNVVTREEKFNFASMFSSCSIGSVHVLFNKIDDIINLELAK